MKVAMRDLRRADLKEFLWVERLAAPRADSWAFHLAVKKAIHWAAQKDSN